VTQGRLTSSKGVKQCKTAGITPGKRKTNSETGTNTDHQVDGTLAVYPPDSLITGGKVRTGDVRRVAQQWNG